MEGKWKASGRQVEGKWKASGRQVEGKWKASGRQVEGNQEEGRKEEGRPEENVEKMRTRTCVRYVEETMMMMTKRHRKGGLDVMRGVAGDGITTVVSVTLRCLTQKLRWICPACKDEDEEQ